MYTPDVYPIKNMAINAQNKVISLNAATYNGTTASTLYGAGGSSYIDLPNGQYMITFTAFLRTTASIRQIIGLYMTHMSDKIDGSAMANYLRVTGTNQGGWSSVTNTFFFNASGNNEIPGANARLYLRASRFDANVTPSGITILDGYGMSGTVTVLRIK